MTSVCECFLVGEITHFHQRGRKCATALKLNPDGKLAAINEDVSAVDQKLAKASSCKAPIETVTKATRNCIGKVLSAAIVLSE